MKQGKTEKAVFAKLSTEKVELGAADDLSDALLDAKQGIDAFNKKANEVVSSAKAILKQSVRVSSGLSNLFKVTEKVEMAAKELGIDAKSIKGYTEAKRIISERGVYEEVADTIYRVVNDLNELS